MTTNIPFMIVVGIDGSVHSQHALEWALGEARLREGQIRLVTAWHYPPLASTVGDGIIDDTFRQAAEETLAEAVETVAHAGIPMMGVVVEESPAVALLHAASDADLVVVGSRGRGGFTGLLLGSVSTHVVHHSSCPVLIVRPRRS